MVCLSTLSTKGCKLINMWLCSFRSKVWWDHDSTHHLSHNYKYSLIKLPTLFCTSKCAIKILDFIYLTSLLKCMNKIKWPKIYNIKKTYLKPKLCSYVNCLPLKIAFVAWCRIWTNENERWAELAYPGTIKVSVKLLTVNFVANKVSYYC